MRPSNTADQLRSGAPVHPAGGGTGRHLSLPYGCRPELRQLHPLVRRCACPPCLRTLRQILEVVSIRDGECNERIHLPAEAGNSDTSFEHDLTIANLLLTPRNQATVHAVGGNSH
jgi:hypothetical protein